MNDSSQPFVLVRTYSAGVHCGYFGSRMGREVTLRNARRIWRWYGANTLNEIALRGISAQGSRVSEPVPQIELLEAIEIIPCSEIARQNLESIGWSK